MPLGVSRQIVVLVGRENLLPALRAVHHDPLQSGPPQVVRIVPSHQGGNICEADPESTANWRFIEMMIELSVKINRLFPEPMINLSKVPTVNNSIILKS